MSQFSILLCITIILRGVGAGIILSIGILINPMQRKMETIAYANFIKELYKGYGVKVYAAITIGGSLLTLLILIISCQQEMQSALRWLLSIAVGVTLIAFTGTGIAYPTMKRLWKTDDDTPALLTSLLNRFQFWGWVNAMAHMMAFFLLTSCFTIQITQQ